MSKAAEKIYKELSSKESQVIEKKDQLVISALGASSINKTLDFLKKIKK